MTFFFLGLRAWPTIELEFLREHSKISECSFKKSKVSGTKAKVGPSSERGDPTFNVKSAE